MFILISTYVFIHTLIDLHKYNKSSGAGEVAWR